jgi:Ethanolamine utilization protein EutJ (predicted chaperonin)
VKQGYFYIANKTQNGKRIGLIFVINVGDGKLLKLATLKYIEKDNSILVVFTPVSKNEADILKKHLKKNSIVQKTFDE